MTGRTPADYGREADRLAAQIEAERYAIEHGMVNDPPEPERVQVSSDPSPQEFIALVGGPDNAAKLVPNLPAAGGIRAITYADLDAQTERMKAFWLNGGGRFPADLQPPRTPPPPPPRVNPRVLRELEEDGITVIGFGAA